MRINKSYHDIPTEMNTFFMQILEIEDSQTPI